MLRSNANLMGPHFRACKTRRRLNKSPVSHSVWKPPYPSIPPKLSDLALSVISANSGSVWIGTRRTAACMKQWLNTNGCTRTNAFYWTDGSATGIAGFVWDTLQPDNEKLSQSCAVLLASRSTVTWGGKFWQPAKMDDNNCLFDLEGKHPRSVYGYVCGKRSR